MMTGDTVPAACTLGAQDGKARFGRWRRLVQRANAGMSRNGNAIVVRFDSGAGIADELQELAAAESECCSFLDWVVTADDGRLTLTVTSPANDAAALDSVAGLWTAT